MTTKQLHATIHSKTPVVDGFLKINRYEFLTEKHAGGSQIIVREVMERGHAVAVLGYDPSLDVVVLVNEFRPGCLVAGDDAYTDNLAAGGIAEGENAVDAAVREMKEETGLDLCEPVLVHPGAFVSSGGTSEKIAIVFGLVDASGAGGIHGNANESEDIRAVVIAAERFIELVRGGHIADLKTLVAGYWFADNHDRYKK